MQSPDSIFNAVSGPCQIRIPETHESLIVLFKIKPRAPKTSSPDPRARATQRPPCRPGGPKSRPRPPLEPSEALLGPKKPLPKIVVFSTCVLEGFWHHFCSILEPKTIKNPPRIAPRFVSVANSVSATFFSQEFVFLRLGANTAPVHSDRARSSGIDFGMFQILTKSAQKMTEFSLDFS